MPEICGAKRRQGQGACKRPAGWGTDHPGRDRCKLHGGNNGAKPGNKNALKSGRYEGIFADALDDEERDLFEAAGKAEKLALIEEEIALTSIRERRMLKRIASLKDAPGGLTLVERSVEVTTPGAADLPSERQLAEMDPDDADEAAGVDAEGPVTKTKEKRAGTLGQIQSIEQDLTAVQTHKARLIKLKHDIETQGGGESAKGSLDELARVIAESAKALEEG